MTVRWIAIVLLTAACGGDTGSTGEPIGATCETDSECESDLCWDFMEQDALCFGKVCSTTCMSDARCVDLAREHGAVAPTNARCGTDGTCDFVGSGLGQFACQ